MFLLSTCRQFCICIFDIEWPISLQPREKDIIYFKTRMKWFQKQMSPLKSRLTLLDGTLTVSFPDVDNRCYYSRTRLQRWWLRVDILAKTLINIKQIGFSDPRQKHQLVLMMHWTFLQFWRTCLLKMSVDGTSNSHEIIQNRRTGNKENRIIPLNTGKHIHAILRYKLSWKLDYFTSKAYPVIPLLLVQMHRQVSRLNCWLGYQMLCGWKCSLDWCGILKRSQASTAQLLKHLFATHNSMHSFWVPTLHEKGSG